jgi:hypothetical protein
MLTLADYPDIQSGTIPGLTYPPDWHREEEAREQAWLNAYARRALQLTALPVQG